MKIKMKRVLALFLSLLLVFATFGDLAKVKAAASYTDVTLTSTDCWNTAVSGDNWVLYLNTSGYESTDWSYKYQGFTIEINGESKTTAQVSSADGNRLYCTIPTSVVPATDGTTFTIKAGKYEPDDAGTTAGLNILNDFDIAVVEGRLAGTKVIEAEKAVVVNGNATTLEFTMQDADGNAIPTGVEDTTWARFLNPAWCDGTRINSASGKWSTTYGGVFVDGSPINYENATFKNYATGTFYINGFDVSGKTDVVLTVRGFFTSAHPDNWDDFNGNFFLKEMQFVYNGSNWSFVQTSSYEDVTLTSTDCWNTAVNGDNWVLYLKTSGYESTDWSYKYEGFTIEINGEPATTAQVSSADGNRLYCTIPTSVVPATDGTTFTIKAGKYEPDAAGTTTGLNILNDFDIAVVEGRLAGTKVIQAEKAVVVNGNATTLEFTMQDADGNAIPTGVEDTTWARFLNPAWCDGTRINSASGKWSTTYGGVFVDGSPINYENATFKNYATGTFYINGFDVSGKTDVVLTVRGFFTSAHPDNWDDFNGNFFLKEMQFAYDGFAWTYVENSSITEYEGMPVFDESDGEAGFYFTAGETAFPYDAASWNVVATAEDTEESGVFLNGEKTGVYLKKVDQDRWYVCMSDAEIVPVEDDEITVVGSFVHKNHRITFAETTFTFNGTEYEGPSTTYNGTPELLEIEEYGSAAGFYFKAGDGAPALGWGTACATLDGDANGVFINDVKTAINLKKTNTDEWYVCISDADTTLKEGDVLTIKGSFHMGTTADIVIFEEKDFTFTGTSFMEGTPDITDFTITGLAYSDIAYDAANSRWNMYFTLSTNIPGDVDATYYPYMTYEINGTEYTTHWFKSSSAHIVNGEKIYNLYFPIEDLPKTLEQEYVITVKAGIQQGRVAGTNAARTDGINLTEDYQFTVGGQYEASAPTIDYLSSNGGNANGIYLSSQDLFPTIGWDYSLTKVAAEDGIIVNGEPTDVFIKKYEDNKYYVCLSDSGITASEGTIVMIRGAFTTAGLNTVAFKTAKYIFTNGQWEVYSTTVVVESTGVDGDAMGDSNLNSADLIRIKRYLKGLEDKIGVVDADLNGTGNIDEKDTVLERKLLIGLIDENGAHIKGAPTYTNTEDEMRLAAYVSPTKDGFADYKAAGFTTLISEHVAVYGTDGFADYMNAATEQGLDVLVQSGNMQGMFDGTVAFDQSFLTDMYNKLSQYESFRGMYMGDEPVISQLENYTNVANVLKTLDKDMDLFTSCHPLYVPNESYLSTDTNLDLYEKYTNYAKAYGDVFNEFSYDFYPFRYKKSTFLGITTSEDRYMRSDWFNNLTIAATTARGLYDTSITVQSYAEDLNAKDHYRDVTEADISFQVYSALAYGMKSINYFTYGEHWDSAVGTTNCMVYNGEKTSIYTAVRDVNEEIKALDHMLLNYTWQGTIGMTGENEDGLFNYADYYNYTSKRIADSSATNDAIIGCLRDVDGYDGFMLVNATDPYDNKTTEVSVTFNSADHAKVYIDGVEQDVELTDGTYSVLLAPGQGVFVIPYME